MADILLEGVREMIGSSAITSNTKLIKEFISLENLLIPNPEQEYTSEPNFLELLKVAPTIYGERGASGIALRIGEASFRCFLRRKGKEYTLTDNSYRLMNSQRRILFGLNKLAEFANHNCGAQTMISEDESRWFWKVEFFKPIFVSPQLLASYTIGLLREFFSWTSGGRFYPIEDVWVSESNITSFQIVISKQPLGN
jgi:hypothetical protein